MASTQGFSTQSDQQLIKGTQGSLDYMYLFINMTKTVRPLKIGYYWYGASNVQNAIEYQYKEGYVTSWGLMIPRVKLVDANKNFDSLSVSWNQPGILWQLFW